MTTLNINNVVNPLLKMMFNFNGSSPLLNIKYMVLCKGTVPGSTESTPVISAGNKLSGFVNINSSDFSNAVGNKASLTGPLTIPIAAGVTSQIPSFIRLYGTNADTYPIIDIPLSLTQEVGKAQISSLSVSTGDVVQLLKLNLSITDGQDMFLSSVVYNSIINSLLDKTSAYGFSPPGGTSYNHNGLRFGMPSVLDSSYSEIEQPIVVEAYSDAVMSDLNYVPTELLWTKSILLADVDYLSADGRNVYSNKTLTANAIATGTATYIRVIKEAAVADTINYPKMVLQLKVGVNCFFSNPNMVLGQPSTLEQFNLVLL